MTSAPDSTGIGSRTKTNGAAFVSRTKCFPPAIKEPTELDILTLLVQKYQGTVTYEKLRADTQAFPPGVDVDIWLTKHKNKFPMHTDGNGKPKVSVFEPKCRVCFSYNSVWKCRKTSCRFLHVCKTYVAGFCRFGSRCKFAHNFHGKDTLHNLKQMQLDSFSDEEIRIITRLSVPFVCSDYGEDGCSRGDSCQKLHLCRGYIMNNQSRCKVINTNKCHLCHDLDSRHTRDILERYGLANLEERQILGAVLVPVGGNKSLKKTSLVPLTEEADWASDTVVTICVDNLLGKCDKGVSCHSEHFSLPYQWILEDQRSSHAHPTTSECFHLSKSRYTFPEDVNTLIEKEFCDADKTEMNITDRCGSVICGLENTNALSINFDDMAVENIHRDGSNEIREYVGRIYRLSTLSYNLADPKTSSECSLATRLRWYFKDSEDVWKPYGLSSGGLAIDDMIKTTYLSEVSTCSFMNGDFHYTVEFSPSMREINWENNCKRKVRRRPIFLSPNGIKDLLTRTQQPSESCSTLPLSWKPMPKDVDFIRYALPPSSQNYMSVEKLFSKTMDMSTITILAIEHIQNSFMWSMYQRQKEHMKTKVPAPDLEWRLFHGTNRDSIAKICKNNFDFRVCGRRGWHTRFGEGSYFACNASFSDYYSKTDGAGWQYMFLADVLVGRYTEGNSLYKRPPEINPETGELYDSCVNRLSDPTTFVIFDRNQLYPTFLIIYTRTTYVSASGVRSLSETKVTELTHRRAHSVRETKTISSAQSKQHKVQCTRIEVTPYNSRQHSGGTSFSATSPSSSSPHNEQSTVVTSTFVPVSVAASQANKPNDLQSTVKTSPSGSSQSKRTSQAISEAFGAQQGVSSATAMSSTRLTSSNTLSMGTATATPSPSMISNNMQSIGTASATPSPSLITSSNMLSVGTATATSPNCLTSSNILSVSTAKATSSPSLISSNMLSVSTAKATSSPSLTKGFPSIWLLLLLLLLFKFIDRVVVVVVDQ